MPPCELYLVRHAIAAERGTEWPDDARRPLTERGIARFTEVVAGLAWFGVAPDDIYTSPLVRARQTAQILAKGVEGHPAVKVLDALAPGHAPADVVRALAEVSTRRHLALVGHEPGLGELAAFLIGSRRPIPFRKGGVCRIDLESIGSKRSGELQWCLPPKVLRKLGA